MSGVLFVENQTSGESSEMNLRYYFYLLLLFVLVFPAAKAKGQDKEKKNWEFCQNNNWSWGDRKSVNELREMTVAKTNLLTVDGQRNGGISVKGENRSDILVRACVQAWADSESAAKSLLQSVKIQTGSVIQAENGNEEKNWSVSYEILVPRNTNLKLTANNGGISIYGVEGEMDFVTKNGGIHLGEVGGKVNGRTQNGGVHVKLNGKSWNGSGLNLETQNGGVHLSLPENYSAKIETETTNGGFHSDFSALQVESKKNWGRRSISKDLNGGGATVRVVTTNGGVHIDSQK